MDAIFIPVASMVGASLDQVKVYQSDSLLGLTYDPLLSSYHVF